MHVKRVCGAVAVAALLGAALANSLQRPEIARKVEFENEYVVIARATIPPRYSGPIHHHNRPSLEIFLTDDHIRETLDVKSHELRARAGEVAWGDPVSHRIENLRDAATEIISIEFKYPPAGPANRPTPGEVASGNFENEYVRVARVKLAPRQKGAEHTHPEYIGVFLTDAKLRIRLSDGRAMDVAGKRGDVSWRAPVTHSVENLANAPFEAIDVNLKLKR